MELCLLLLVLLPCFHQVMAQPTTARSQEAKSLDAILQEYAYGALVRPKTGTIYDATHELPSNLSGVNVAALRLRSGSLRRYGVPFYNEFQIPKGLTQRPYVKRLVLVYQNLGNWSTTYYPFPNYTYLAPVLGLLAYNGSDLSATTNPSHLDVNASAGNPIKVRFQDVKSAPHGTVPKCVWFDLRGSSNFTNVTGGNTCSTFQQGHFSIVVESPSPSSPPQQGGESNNNRVWVIVGSVLGGLVLLAFLSLLVLWVVRCKHDKKIRLMERATEEGEALHMASVGDTKAPAATVTRTMPTLEHEFTP